MASPVQIGVSAREPHQAGVRWKIQGIFRDLPDYIPLTPAFRRHYEGEIAKHVAADLRAFDDLATAAAPYGYYTNNTPNQTLHPLAPLL